MALEFRMIASEVKGTSGTVWEPCPEDADGARSVEEVFGNYLYGVPVWLDGATHVRTRTGHAQESFTLSCVRSEGPDDPANAWWTASPFGSFSGGIDNPEGFGYLQPGAEYRVTVEKIRGPRKSKDSEA